MYEIGVTQDLKKQATGAASAPVAPPAAQAALRAGQVEKGASACLGLEKTGVEGVACVPWPRWERPPFLPSFLPFPGGSHGSLPSPGKVGSPPTKTTTPMMLRARRGAVHDGTCHLSREAGASCFPRRGRARVRGRGRGRRRGPSPPLTTAPPSPPISVCRFRAPVAI